jgi:hypothetical protein
MDCASCPTYRRRVLIRSTPQLRHLIGQLQAAVAARRLHCEHLDQPRHRCLPARPFDALQAAEPLPDLLHYYFSCPDCRRIFALLCDTFAAAGGQWWVAGRLPPAANIESRVPLLARWRGRHAANAASAGSPAAPTGSPASG